MATTTISNHLHITAAEGCDYTRPLFEAIHSRRMPDGAVCIYPGSRNQLYSIPSPHGMLVVKCFRCPNAVNAIAYTTVRRSKACRSFLNSLVLMRAGLKVPEPLAFAEERHGLRMGKSYYLSRNVEGDTIRFYEMRPDCDRMLHALAVEMLRMHLYGIYHKDFSPGNVIVETRPDGSYTFRYVDLNRMDFNVSNHRKQLRMFERINYTRIHTVRLAHAYASLLPLPRLSYDALMDIRSYDLISPERPENPLAGLYPLMREDALIRRGKDFIAAGAEEAFRNFWHSRNRKKRLFHPFRK